MTNVTAQANDIRDIKPPVDIPNGWEWLWWVLAALAAIAVAVLIWRWWQKRRSQIPVVPPVPAHVRAKEKLAEALALIAQPKPFVIAVSDTARTYFEERFDFHAPERTTEEFLHELQATDLLAEEQKENLGEFSRELRPREICQIRAARTGAARLHGSAVRLVEETEPTEIPNSGSRISDTNCKYAWQPSNRNKS